MPAGGVSGFVLLLRFAEDLRGEDLQSGLGVPPGGGGKSCFHCQPGQEHHLAPACLRGYLGQIHRAVRPARKYHTIPPEDDLVRRDAQQLGADGVGKVLIDIGKGLDKGLRMPRRKARASLGRGAEVAVAPLIDLLRAVVGAHIEIVGGLLMPL